jgi:hypothetical protein
MSRPCVRAFTLVEIAVVVAVTVVLAALAVNAVAQSLQQSSAQAAFERFHLDILELRRRAVSERVVLRVCADPCARAVVLGVPAGALLVEEIPTCAAGAALAPPRFRVLDYGVGAQAFPDGSADGVCVHVDGHVTGFDGLGLTRPTWNGFTLRTNTFTTRLDIEPTTGDVLGATGAFAPLPFADNLADRSQHGAPLP